MKWLCIQCALLVGLGFGQAGVDKPNAEAPIDPYRNFVGSWTGKSLVNSERGRSTVTLSITEEKEQNRMRWDYVFGVKGKKGYEAITKFVVLKPFDEEVFFHFVGDPEGHYKSHGLADFTRAGFGDFTVRAFEPSPGRAMICTFHLEALKLSYLWQETTDGKHFETRSLVAFNRVAASPGGEQSEK